MQIGSQGGNLPEILKPIFSEKWEKNIDNVSSAVFA